LDSVTPGPSLVRGIRRWEIVGLSINDVIGSGIYLLPAAAAALLGTWSTAAVALAGALVGLLVLCFAEASTHFDEPGGAFLYTREAFGPFVGFQVGWMTWLARIASVASLSNGLALALGFLWADAATGWLRVVAITVTLGVLTWINVVGVKAGARAAVVLTVAKLVPLAAFVVLGAWHVDPSLLVGTGLPEGTDFGEAALLLLFAYAGFENTPAAAGEYRNPRRDVPIALIVSMSTITAIYCLVQVVALGTLPGLAESETPLADAATGFLGGWGGLLMTIGAVVSIVGNIGNTTLMGPRYLYALAADGYGPRVLAAVHPRHHTPAVAIGTQSALALALALSGSFVQLAMLSVIARLATYLGTAAAVPVLRRRMPRRPDAFRLPGGPLVPAAAFALSLVFLASTSAANLWAGAAALGVGVVIYRFRRAARLEA
jgi:amino acid transporter